MVNPQKYVNNLNQDDIENIYKNLCKEYEQARDKNTKKNLNQKILILILLSRRFPVQELVKIRYDFFKPEPQNSILYKHLLEHSLNAFCQLDGLLLTDVNNNPLTVEDVESIIGDIDTGEANKKLSVNTLNVTNSILNGNGKVVFSRKKIKKYLGVKSDAAEREEKSEKKSVSKEDIDLTDTLVDKISERVISHLDEIRSTDSYAQELAEVRQKQEILEDSLAAKHNQLTNKINKIHQNVKASNNRYNQFQTYFNELALVRDFINTSIKKQNSQLSQMEDRFDEILEKVEKIEVGITKNNPIYIKEVEDMATNINALQKVSDDINFVELREFVYNWFNRNMKITKSPLDAVDMDEIRVRLDKYIEDRNVKIDRKLLYERLESYLSSWYGQHDTIEEFKNIRDKTITGTEFYSYLKFINLREERENRIKNSIMAWLKDNTCEVEGSKTYTQDIFEHIEPIFSQNGWIITTQEEWKELHTAGFSKAVPNRTFSQIIGKAVQEVYHSISKDTIQRDTPNGTGNVTWYPNIEILDKEVSDSLESAIEDELSNVIFESDNIIYGWLKNNLTFTSDARDKVSISVLHEKLLKHMQIQEIRISQKSLETMFTNVLKHYLEDYGVELKGSEEISGFALNEEYGGRVDKILTDWMENHLTVTDNSEDRTYLEDLREKLLSALYHENISVVSDALYSQLPGNLKHNVITQDQFEERMRYVLKDNITAEKIDDDVDGTYYRSLKLIRYKTLNEEHVRMWINTNIHELLKTNVASKKDIVDNFRSYIGRHNIKNNTQHTISELLDVAIDEYYSNINEVSFKLLNDTQNEYYVLINQ